MPSPETPDAAPSAAPVRKRMGAPAPTPEQTATPPSPVAASSPTPPAAKPPAPNRPVWVKPVLTAAVALVAALLVVLVARWLRTLPAIDGFIGQYPGHVALPESAPTGIPAWLAWQHFLNMFFMVLIIRTGIQVRRTQRPAAYWTRKNTGLLKTRRPPKKISLDLWLHLTLDFLWALNGIVFMVLLFATGQWMRITPTSWDVFPNAASALLQYASLDWPTENGWVNYNSLQVLAYFATVFIAAPLSLITGLRMSNVWPADAKRLNRFYPVELARAVHFPVMGYFVAFIAVHVFLVFFTGVLANLNHMYASNDGASWAGFWVFAASLAVVAAAWLLARPLFLRPLAALTGSVTK
ncbi:cytochrome b/b6 domain-containing protein [Arthrobacter sp. 18067]|uniref:cytochrome b/b6 domain-containing protein n=1 Tax=Arthrobacter sp. 18067 TaxID=2681413 RepID=UPI001F2E893B|nr:cytochrome b/b6 domain-containing protein [Arthrobacter sp. 18067]